MKFLRNSPALISLGLTSRMNSLLRRSVNNGAWEAVNKRIAILRLWRMELARGI